MDLHTLELFMELSRTEHMSETADLFNISQPALSKSISRLETELGVQLFDRVGRRIRLNRNGENFASYIGKAMEYLDMGVESTRLSRYEITGSIKIRCYAFAGILTKCIAGYAALNPMTDFTLLQSGGANDREKSDFDFILYSSSGGVREEGDTRFWVSRQLFPEGNFVIVSPRHPALEGKGEIRSLSQLREVPFITTSHKPGVLFRDITLRVCQSAGFVPRIAFYTDNFYVKAMLVREGAGATIVPASCLTTAREIAGEELLVIPLTEENTLRSVSLMRRPDTMMTEAAADFWEYVMDYYGLTKEAEG